TLYVFFFQAEDGIRAFHVTGVQTCALPIWANSPGIAETDDAIAIEKGHAGIAADATLMHFTHRLEHDLGRELVIAVLVEAVREDVENDLRIRVCVEVAAIGVKQHFLELGGIDEIAVVNDGNAERRIRVERLRLVSAG